MSNWLVTGGAGFIGSNIVRTLVAGGESVRVVDNLVTGNEENLEDVGADFVEGDLCDSDVADYTARDIDYVLHQAALGSVPRSVDDPATTNYNNTQSTINVLEAARRHRVKMLVYASSASIYGDADPSTKHEGLPPAPANPYAVSKLAAEEYVKVAWRVHGQRTVALRYFNVYGPRQSPDGAYAAVVPLFCRAALAGEAMRVHGDGKQFRDFTFVDDVVAANLLAAKCEDEAVFGKFFNAGAGGNVTVNDLAHAVMKATGKKTVIMHGPPRRGDVRGSISDSSAARTVFKYKARIGLGEGIRRTVAWHKTRQS